MEEANRPLRTVFHFWVSLYRMLLAQSTIQTYYKHASPGVQNNYFL